MSVTEIDQSDLLSQRDYYCHSWSNSSNYHEKIDQSDHCLSLKLIDSVYYHREIITVTLETINKQ